MKDKVYNVIYKDNKDESIYIEYCNMAKGTLRIDTSGRVIHENMYNSEFDFLHDTLVSIDKNIGDKVFDPVNNLKKLLPESFKMEIIYSGLEDGNVKATYREYSDDLLRPSFFQDVSYSLDKIDKVRYRQFKIKIFNATNEVLEYAVLED